MNTITRQTRRESYREILPECSQRRKQVLAALDGKKLTAGEVAWQLYKDGLTPYYNRNFAHPRLNELEQEGKVKIVGKKTDNITKRTCAVYEVMEDAND